MIGQTLVSIMGEAMFFIQSLPSHLHLWVITTLERLLLLLSLLLNAYVCILFVKTWKFPTQEKKLDEERILAIEKYIAGHSKVRKWLVTMEIGISRKGVREGQTFAHEPISFFRLTGPR